MRFEKLSYGNINFYHRYLKMVGSSHASILKINMILLMRCFFCGLSRNTNSFSR